MTAMDGQVSAKQFLVNRYLVLIVVFVLIYNFSLQPLNGRNIHVSFANDKPRNSFGDRSGGGGGYGNPGF